MTKNYALQKLLEHGELTSKEIEQITCWKKNAVWATIVRLRKAKIVRKYPDMKWGLTSIWPYPTTVTSLNLQPQESYFAHTK